MQIAKFDTSNLIAITKPANMLSCEKFVKETAQKFFPGFTVFEMKSCSYRQNQLTVKNHLFQSLLPLSLYNSSTMYRL